MDNKPKITLIGVYNYKVEFEEVGISFLASYLRKYGYSVQLLSKSLDELDINSIVNFSPDIVGFTCYYNNMDAINKVNNELKEKMPELVTVAGGTHATFIPEDVLTKIKNLNVVIRGEGEGPLLNLVRCIEEKKAYKDIKGISYISGDKFVHNEINPKTTDMESLPMMARDTLVDNKFKIAQISSSRGCMANCSFCICSKFWGKWRGRMPTKIIQEIKYVREAYGVDIFDFVDASFEDPDKLCKRLIEIAQELIKNKLNIYYTIQIRADIFKNITSELMELLIASGLVRCFIGVDAANESDLKLYRKKSTLDECLNIVSALSKYDVGIQLGMISFNPYSTRETIKSNISYLNKYKMIHRFYGLVAFEGADIIEKIRKDGLLDTTHVFGYKFINPDVEEITSFIAEYKKIKLTTEYQQLNDISEDLNLFAYLMIKKCEFVDRKDLINAIKIYMLKNNTLLSHANDIAAQWMNDLYTIWEPKWDENRALKYSEAFWNNTKFFDLIKNMNINRYAFHAMIVRNKL